MQKKTLLTCLAVGAAISFLPSEAFAQTTTDFASQDFLVQSGKIQNCLFGPVTRIAGVLGGAYGLMQAILTSSLKPLIIYGGIGLAVGLIPKNIDGVFSVWGDAHSLTASNKGSHARSPLSV
jgi:hypothetical protein